MTKLTLFSMLCTIVLGACHTPKDMSLYYDNHLNDTTHLSNPEIKKQKEEVFKQVVKFDKWYRKNYEEIVFNSGTNFWNTSYDVDTDDSIRISLIRENIIPALKLCPFLTKKLNDKALKNANAEDPQNLGAMLTNSNFGKELQILTYYQQESEYAGFHGRCFLNSRQNLDQWDDTPDRKISEEEALFYHLTMIKIYDNNKAVYRVSTGMTNFTLGNEAFLVLELTKESGDWRINDIYFIAREELIEDPRGMKGLIDYNNGYPGIEIP